jgi:colanic acid/amylovoran biosynthesis glycosyltransferase
MDGAIYFISFKKELLQRISNTIVLRKSARLTFMKIAYLINIHPGASSTFIRREIVAIEDSGVPVLRFGIRPPEGEILDEGDREEFSKTQHIIRAGIFQTLTSLIAVILTRPIQFFETLLFAIKTGRSADKGIVFNLIYFVEACVLFRWLIQAEIDHLHIHFGTNSTTVGMLCKKLGGPNYSFTVHGPEEFDKPKALCLTEKIENASLVIAISSFGKSQLFRWCGYKHWSKIHVVHCGLDRMFLSQSYVPLPDERRFVCIGRLSEQKGHLLLIEAVSQLASEGLKFKVILVGDGYLREQIEFLIKTLGLEDYFEITGWATNLEVRQQILNSQVMVLPSFAEGLPVVIMEALALGRPVISTQIAGIPELVETGKSGWLVTPGSSEALASAMREAMHLSVAQLSQMGKTGAEAVAKEHDIDREAEKLLKLFQTYSQPREEV